MERQILHSNFACLATSRNEGLSLEAAAALREVGLLVDKVVFDGTWHRSGTADKPDSQNGSYIAHAFPAPVIFWKNHRTGNSGRWPTSTTHNLTTEEQEELARHTEETKRKTVQRHAKAADNANSIYMAAVDCMVHSYLTRKGVKPVRGLKVSAHGELIVPITSEKDSLTSLLFIAEDGVKRFLGGGEKKGGSFLIGTETGNTPILICEGLATGLSLYECTGCSVLVALDAGNILPVAVAARHRFSGRELIICADNDTETPGNPGLAKATAAASAVSASLVVPHLDGAPCDWNDLHSRMGMDEVCTQFQQRTMPKQPAPALSQTQAPRPLRVVNAGEFLNMTFPEREMLLAPILARQALIMLHAQRGVGKTFISLSIALAVATGGKVFSRWGAPKPARVLFIDGEMPAQMLQERLASLVAGNEQRDLNPDFLRILTPDMQEGAMPNIATPEGQEAIAPLLEDVDLVIVDNLATLARHGRANEEESWLPVQTWLLSLRRRGISVLLVHHQGKGGDQRGTSAKEDILDTVISLRSPDDYRADQGARFEVHLTKARGIYGPEAKPFEAQLFQSGNTLTWTTKDVTNHKHTQVEQLVKNGTSVREAAKIVGMSKSAAGRLKKEIESAQREAMQNTISHSKKENTP